jgi:CheY-like chemotaxis protein
MPRTADSSSSTSKSIISVPRDTDESIIDLRARVKGQKVILHGFDIETKDPIIREMGKLLKASITTFLANWYGLRVVPPGQKANIIVANEATPGTISTLVKQATSLHKSTPSIIVLCSHSSRFDRSLSSSSQCNVGFVAKPVGPLKLAKAITQCFEGESGTITPGPDGPTHSSESSDLSNVFEELSLSPRGGEVLDNSRMAADSANARKAIESPTPNAIVEKHAEFPFPQPQPDEKPSFPKSVTMPADKTSLQPLTDSSTQAASVTLISMEKVTSAPKEPKSKLKSPTMLLVDDNQINLRLLSTYLTRRNYEIIDEAQHGLEAVQKVEARQGGYDIIFMDITMPILDGFGATRQIRAIEDTRQKRASETEKSMDTVMQNSAAQAVSPNSALIIAFTGRSSIEDQTEAVRVGIDLFMTKPVAFKEVGKIIDNWVANREREARGSESGSGG